jgi:hypothetical protein
VRQIDDAELVVAWLVVMVATRPSRMVRMKRRRRALAGRRGADIMPAMVLELVGTERLTLEIDGRLPGGLGRELPAGLVPESDHEGVVVNVLLFWMEGLGVRGLSRPRFDYAEALFRVGVVDMAGPAWFALACDLDHPVVAALGAALVRYPVRRSRFEAREDEERVEVSVDAAGVRLEAVASISGTAPIVSPQRVLVASGGHLFRIPWREDPPPSSNAARVEVRADDLARNTFGGSISWRAEGRLLRGRVHRCGLASRA